MDKDKILKGIESYKEYQDLILDVIHRYDGKLHQKDFDNEFSDRPPSILPVNHTDDTFILGGMMPDFWSICLDLLQQMARAGLVKIEGTPPNVTYLIGDEG